LSVQRTINPWLSALILGVLAFLLDLPRQPPTFGVGITLWPVFPLLATTFLGVRCGVVSVLVAVGLLYGFTDHLAYLSDTRGVMLQVVFIGAYLNFTKSLRILEATLWFWLVSMPFMIFWHQSLFALDFNAGVLVIVTKLNADLFIALVIQWLTFKPNWFSRFMPPHRISTRQMRYDIHQAARAMLTPVGMLVGLIVAQFLATESLYVRTQDIEKQANKLYESHLLRSELILFQLRRAATEDVFQQAALAEPLASRYIFVCDVTDLNATSRLEQGCAAEHTVRNVMPLVSDFGSVWIDLDVFADIPFLHDEQDYLAHSLVFEPIDPASAEDLRSEIQPASPNPSRHSRLEAMFFRTFVGQGTLSGLQPNQPVMAMKMGILLQDPVELNLSSSIWGLLAAFSFFTIAMSVYRRVIRRATDGVTDFSRRLSAWRPGTELMVSASPEPFAVLELEAFRTAFERLVNDFNDNWRELQMSAQRRASLLARMQGLFKAISAPMSIIDGSWAIRADEYNVAAAPLQPWFSQWADAARRLVEIGETPSIDTFAPSEVRMIEAIAKAHEDGESTADIELTLKHYFDDGGEHYYLATVTPVQGLSSDDSDADTEIVIVMIDTSALVEARRKLTHSAKMASIGEVASGAAHELNQPLNVIRMATHNVLRAVAKGTLDNDSLVAKLERVDQQVDRAARLVTGMKAFSKTSNETITMVDPSVAVAVALELMHKRITGDNVEVTHHPIEKPVTVNADNTALQQVVINVVMNALEAFEVGKVEEKQLFVEESVTEDQFVLAIADNAGGVDPLVLDRIFEPFFTTRGDDYHPGLGLSTCYGIVEGLGGSIVCEPIANGARFVVRLPINVDLFEVSEDNPLLIDA
jgi:signal transduction histidine kinase